MGILSVTQAANGYTWNKASDWSKTITQKLLIKTSGAAIGPAYLDANLGSWGFNFFDTYTNVAGTDTDSSCVLTSWSFDLVSEAGNLWAATLNYGPYDPYTMSSTGSPLDIKALPAFEPNLFEVPFDVDAVSGNPVVNSAGDFFDPPRTRQIPAGILRVTKNMSSFTSSTLMGYSTKVNSDSWNGFDPYYLRCDPPRINVRYNQLIGNYINVEFAFVYHAFNWRVYLIDQGYRQLVSGVRRNILIDNAPATFPVPLSSGTALTPPVDSSSITILDFDAYKTLDYTSTFGAELAALNF